MAFNKKKVLFIATGVITVVVLAIILAFLFNIKGFKPQIETAASSALGMDIRIKGGMGINFFPDLGISLKDVSVQNGGSEVVSIEKIKLGLKLIPLMRGAFQISGVGLIKPVFSIVRNKSGAFNIDGPGTTQSVTPFAVKRISISQGNLVYTDEKSGGKLEAGDLDVTIRNVSYSGTNSAAPYRNISFAGDGRCKIVKINSFTVTNLVMKTAGDNGIGEVNPVSMNIFGGTGKGSIQVDVTGSLPHYRILYALERFRIEEFLQECYPKKVSQKVMEGLTDFSADVTATGKSVDELKRSLKGDVSLNGENLMLYNLDIDALIQEYARSQNFNLMDVGAFFLAGPFGPALTKSYNSASLYAESKGGKGIIRKLVSVWKVNDGIAVATDVALASKKHRIAMKGELDFVNERFVDVTIAVLNKRGCAAFSQNVNGSFRNPHMEKTSILTSLAGPVLNALDDTWKFFRNQECPVFYSGSVLHPGE